MEKDLSILTEKQRIAYLLREQGLTYKSIGKKMGISASAAQQNVKGAEQRFYEYEKYHAQQERDKQPIDFPLTRGELNEILAAVRMLEWDLIRQSTNFRRGWGERLTYRCQVVNALSKRIQIALCGRVVYSSLVDLSLELKEKPDNRLMRLEEETVQDQD